MDACLETLDQEIGLALAGLSAEQAQVRPGGDPARWNVQQIVGHLRLTYGATVDAMAVRIGRGVPTKARPSLRQRAAQVVVVGWQRYPGRRKAPEAVTVGSEAALSGEALTAGIRGELVRMDEAISAAGEMFGGSCRCVSHMILGPMRVGQWRRFHLVHGRHHLGQIWAVRREVEGAGNR